MPIFRNYEYYGPNQWAAKEAPFGSASPNILSKEVRLVVPEGGEGLLGHFGKKGGSGWGSGAAR